MTVRELVMQLTKHQPDSEVVMEAATERGELIDIELTGVGTHSNKAGQEVVVLR